jgi:hypothetical protein
MNAPTHLEGFSLRAHDDVFTDDLEAFTSLSSWLTGFDLTDVVGAAAVARRFELFTRETPAIVCDGLLAAWRSAADAPERRRAVTDDRRWAPWTRALVKLWYQGRWTSPLGGAVVLTPSDPGLMWRALGVLPQGVDAPGLGRWGAPPPLAARAG